MATTIDYDLDKMLPGVMSAWLDAAGCHWCGRDTRDPIVGHDGYCPIPAVFRLQLETQLLQNQRTAQYSLMQKLRSLLQEWSRTPFFETKEEWQNWVSDFGSRVDKAIGK